MIRHFGFVLLSLTLIAQPPPPAGAAAPAPTGTGVIEGRVTDSATGSPVPNASVATFGQAVRVVRTGPSGDFRMENLPAGMYMLSTELRGVLGSARMKTIQLGEGEQKSGVVLSLDPPATIRGEITDETGDPIAGCQVQALRRLSTGPEQGTPMGGSQASDDHGRYEIVGLVPGKYFLTVHCGEVFGRHGYSEERQRPIVSGYVYPTIRYPSEPASGGLVIKGGETLDHTDFSLTPVPAVTVRVVGPVAGGQRLEGTVNVADRPSDNPHNGLAHFSIMASMPQPFALYPMLPKGSYSLNSVLRDPQGEILGYASQTFTVDGDHPLTVGIQPQAPPRLEGSIDWLGDPPKRNAGGSPAPSGTFGRRPVSIVGAGNNPNLPIPVPQPAADIQVMLLPVSGSASASFGGPGQRPARPVDESNRFNYDAILPGRYRVSVIGAPGYVKSVNLGGQTIEGDTFELGPGAAPPMTIAFSNKMATLEVTVEGRAADANYVLFATPKAGDPGRAQVSAIPSTGRATMTAPPGEYRVLVIPVEEMRAGRMGPPEPDAGQVVTLVEGSTVTVTLEPEKVKP